MRYFERKTLGIHFEWISDDSAIYLHLSLTDDLPLFTCDSFQFFIGFAGYKINDAKI